MLPSTPPRQQARCSPSKRAQQAQASPQVKAALQAYRRKKGAVKATSTSEQLHDAAAFGGGALRGPQPEHDDGDAFLDWGFKSITTLIQASYTTGRLNLSSRELAHLPRALFPSLENESSDEQSVTRGMLDLSIAPTATLAATPWYEREPLRSLNAANNLLEDINSEIEELGELVVLDLHSNSLKDLPLSFAQLSNLTSLNLSGNHLSHIPTALQQLPSLARLLLQNNAISSVPSTPSEGDFPSLRLLDLSENSLTSLGLINDFVRELKRPVVLTGLPDERAPMPLAAGPALEIRLSGNRFVKSPSIQSSPTSTSPPFGIPISSHDERTPSPIRPPPRDPPVPDAVPTPVLKQEENINSPLLEDIRNGLGPDEDVQLPSQEPANGEANGAHEPPRQLEPETEAFLTGYSAAKSALVASSRHLVALPPPPLEPLAVSTLDVSHNRLPSLDLGRFAAWNIGPTLRRLNLSNNHLATVVVSGTYTLTALTDLDLSHNRLLSTLVVNGTDTPLLSLIALFGPRLSHVDLSFNRLETTSGVSGLLAPERTDDRPWGVQTLLLDSNKLSDLSGLCDVASSFKDRGRRAIDSWRCRELVLSNNNISQLPPVLGHLPHDLQINVEGNAFRIPRREVYVDGGSKGLLEYLLDRC